MQIFTHSSLVMLQSHSFLCTRSLQHTFQPLRCPKREVYNELSVYLRQHHGCHQRENFGFFFRIFTYYLKDIILPFFTTYFAKRTMNHCKSRLLTWIYSVSLHSQQQLSSYAVETPKDEVTCNTHWNFYKKLKIWTCFSQNGRFRDQTGGQEITSQNGSLPFKTGGLEHMLQQRGQIQKYSRWLP